ncbi:hypothetical protein J6590_036709 [Homalodisca vitripennis]|nr:hypothetical protein J6590_036709 [Homalodisca vitripennis]
MGSDSDIDFTNWIYESDIESCNQSKRLRPQTPSAWSRDSKRMAFWTVAAREWTLGARPVVGRYGTHMSDRHRLLGVRAGSNKLTIIKNVCNKIGVFIDLSGNRTRDLFVRKLQPYPEATVSTTIHNLQRSG